MMKTLLQILLTLLIFQSVQAQFPEDIPYQSIPTPSGVDMPAYLESVTDYSVSNPIQITRISEPYYYNDNNGDPQVWYPTHEYAKIQVWNADQSLFKIRSWKVIDASTYEEVQMLSDMYPSYWSNTNPDLIWSFRENGDIKKSFVSTGISVVVGQITGYEIVQLGPGEGNMDIDDHYVALVGKKANGDLDVIVYDLQNTGIVAIKTFEGAWGNGGAGFPDYIDWVSVSQSGNYVVIMWNHDTTSETNPFVENGNSHYGVEVYNTTDMQYLHRIVDYGNHGDLGFATDGSEVLVQFYGNGSGTLYMHKLDGTESNIELISHPDFGVAGHVSCRNIQRPGWAYITHSLQEQTGQVVAVKLDGSGTVEHFGHHFSSSGSYEQAPMAVVSPDGAKLCFRSDFGTAPDDPSVVYMFIAQVENTESTGEQMLTCVHVYPNPVRGFVNIEIDGELGSIEMYNHLGQLIRRYDPEGASRYQVEVSGLPQGIYTFRIWDKSGSQVVRKWMVK